MTQSAPSSRRVPKEGGCYFAGTRSSWECWGCPNIRCQHMEIPYSHLENTFVVADMAAEKVTRRQVAKYREIVEEMGGTESLRDNIFKEGFALAGCLRVIQAKEAVLYGLATVPEAAGYANLRKGDMDDDLSCA